MDNLGYLNFRADKAAAVVLFLILSMPLIAGFSITTVTASDDAAELPEWTRGDSWRYEREQDKENTTVTENYIVNVTSENVNLDLDNVEHKCYETVYTYQDDGTVEKHYFKKSDLREAVYIKSDGEKVFYKPLWARLDFPLKDGKTWDVQTKQYENKTGDPIAEINLTYECKGEEMVRVPAGDIISYKINRTDHNDNSSFVVTYYSPEVENFVKKEYISNGKIIGQDVLIDFSIEEDDSTPYPSLPFFTVILAATSAVFYLHRKHS